jgi:hypothetical protein
MAKFFLQVIGIFLLFGGLFFALLVVVFGGMIDPSLSDTDWWIVFARGTWLGLSLTLGMAAIGGWLCVRLILPRRWTPIQEPEHFLFIDREKPI